MLLSQQYRRNMPPVRVRDAALTYYGTRGRRSLRLRHLARTRSRSLRRLLLPRLYRYFALPRAPTPSS